MKKKNYDVVTIGSALRDIMFFTDRGRVFLTPDDLTAQRHWAFEYGAKVNIDQSYDQLGGGAFNTAFNFHVMGFNAAPIIRVGNDLDGKWIQQYMKMNNIDDHFVQIDEKIKTGMSFILCNAKRGRDHLIFAQRGANENLSVSQNFLKNIETKWVFLSSLNGKNWYGVTENIFSEMKVEKTKFAWNPGMLQLRAGKKNLLPFLQKTDVLILNKDEAIELVLSGIKIGNRDPSFVNKPVYLLNILNEWGPKIVVITLGRKGAVALYNGKVCQQKILDKKVVDTTGVGDAFGAAFIGGLIHEKGDIQKSLIWGIVNSSYVVTKVGAHNGILTRKKLLSIAKKMYA